MNTQNFQVTVRVNGLWTKKQIDSLRDVLSEAHLLPLDFDSRNYNSPTSVTTTEESINLFPELLKNMFQGTAFRESCVAIHVALHDQVREVIANHTLICEGSPKYNSHEWKHDTSLFVKNEMTGKYTLHETNSVSFGLPNVNADEGFVLKGAFGTPNDLVTKGKFP